MNEFSPSIQSPWAQGADWQSLIFVSHDRPEKNDLSFIQMVRKFLSSASGVRNARLVDVDKPELGHKNGREVLEFIGLHLCL